MRELDERDELAELIGCTMNNEFLDPSGKTAEAVIAAGYRKARQVTTLAELDALPRFTVIRSDEGAVFERQTMWHEAGSRDLMYSPGIALPATVLQLGWGEE